MLFNIQKYTHLKKYVPNFFFFLLKFIYHFLRFYNLIIIPYNLSKSISFNNNNFYSNKFFLNALKKSKILLEYGSGNTTLFADSKKKIIYSVEGDKNFYNSIKKLLNSKKTHLFYKSLGITEFGSYPVSFNLFKFFFKKNYINYAQDVLTEFQNKNIFPDLVLIDGRFRVLCSIYLYIYVKKNFHNFKKKPLIIFDDFSRRNYYSEVSKFFYVKKYNDFGLLVDIKHNVKNIERYISKYCLDPR
jgi:hypothetical protein